MIKKLTRHGNSLALVIDKSILDQTGVDENTPLTLAFDGRNLLVTRASSPTHQRKLRTAMDQIHKEYGHALRRLVE